MNYLAIPNIKNDITERVQMIIPKLIGCLVLSFFSVIHGMELGKNFFQHKLHYDKEKRDMPVKKIRNSIVPYHNNGMWWDSKESSDNGLKTMSSVVKIRETMDKIKKILKEQRAWRSKHTVQYNVPIKSHEQKNQMPRMPLYLIRQLASVSPSADQNIKNECLKMACVVWNTQSVNIWSDIKYVITELAQKGADVNLINQKGDVLEDSYIGFPYYLALYYQDVALQKILKDKGATTELKNLKIYVAEAFNSIRNLNEKTHNNNGNVMQQS